MAKGFDFRGQLREGCRILEIGLETEAVERLLVYFTELLHWSRKINLIAKGTGEAEILENHFLDSLTLLPLLAASENSHLLGCRHRGRVPRTGLQGRPTRLNRNSAGAAVEKGLLSPPCGQNSGACGRGGAGRPGGGRVASAIQSSFYPYHQPGGYRLRCIFEDGQPLVRAANNGNLHERSKMAGGVAGYGQTLSCHLFSACRHRRAGTSLFRG